MAMLLSKTIVKMEERKKESWVVKEFPGKRTQELVV